MSTAVIVDARVNRVRVTASEIIAHLTDGRVISVPLAWSWRLAEATSAKRGDYRLVGGGRIIHWPQLDEDISVEGMLQGAPAPRPAVMLAGPTRDRGKGTGRGRTTSPRRQRTDPPSR